MAALDRRLAMKDLLSQKRETTIEYLMSRFNASKSTVRRDLDYLETEMGVPLLRQSGNGGGIRVLDGWYATRHCLSPAQEAFLRGLLPRLDKEDRVGMEEILSTLGISGQR